MVWPNQKELKNHCVITSWPVKQRNRTHFLITHDSLTSKWCQINSKGSIQLTWRDSEGRIIIMPLWHTGVRKKTSEAVVKEDRDRPKTCSHCNQHLYPSSLATVKCGKCRSHPFTRPQKCIKPLKSIRRGGRSRKSLSVSKATEGINLFMSFHLLSGNAAGSIESQIWSFDRINRSPTTSE